MQPYAIKFHARVHRDLNDIYDYITFEKKSTGGRYVLEELVQACMQLRYEPAAVGHPKMASNGEMHYMINKWRYHIYYTVDESTSVVTISKIYHGARRPW